MVQLTRIKSNDKQTEGILIHDDYSCKTLELPWRDNQKRISRIPSGTYNVIKHTSPSFGRCFWILNVPDRSEILIHKGNYHNNTLGCVLVGREFRDIDGDGYIDVTQSVAVMGELLERLPDSFQIEIRDKDII